MWEAVEEPRLQGWCSGLEIDLGPEGTRLRRYEAAADRLFRSAWTKLERLRKERGEPLIPRAEPRARPRARHHPRPRPRRQPRPQCPRPRAGLVPRFRGRRCSAIRRRRCSTSGSAARPGPGSAPALSPRTRRTRRRADPRKEQPPWSATCRSDPVGWARSDPSPGPRSSGDTVFPGGMP